MLHGSKSSDGLHTGCRKGAGQDTKVNGCQSKGEEQGERLQRM
jgi:hypothetical protein